MPYRLQALKDQRDQIKRIEQLECQVKELSVMLAKASEDNDAKPIFGPGFGGRLMLTAGTPSGMMAVQHTADGNQADGPGMM